MMNCCADSRCRATRRRSRSWCGATVRSCLVSRDAKTGADLLPRLGHAARIDSVAVAADGTVVTAAGAERTVCWWDLERGRELRRKRLDGTGPLLCATLTADGRGLFAVNAGDVEFIDLVSGLTSKVAAGPIKPYPAVMSVSGSTALHAASDHKMRAWDA